MEWSSNSCEPPERPLGSASRFLIRQEQIRVQAAVTEAINHIRGRICDDRRRGRRRSLSVCIGKPASNRGTVPT